MIDRFERFVSVISSISRNLHRIMSEEMEKYGLKGPYAVYLVALSRNEDGITAARLSEICEKNKAAVSRALAELEKIHLIERESSGYRAKIRLTPEGKAAADYVRVRAILAVEQAGGDLSMEQRKIFYESLELIAKKLHTIGNNGLAH